VERGVEGRGIKRGESAKNGGRWEARKACSKCSLVLGNCVLDWRNGEHVMEGFDWGGVEGTADMSDRNILSHLEDLDKGFCHVVGPDRESVQEDGEYDGMINGAPGVKVDAANGVAK